MAIKLVLFSALFGILASVQASAANDLADDVLLNLYTMKSVYRATYAPADWKKKFANYDLESEFSKAVAAIQANPQLTLADAHKILMDFVYSMKDYHVQIAFHSTEMATLPFVVRGAEGRVFIVDIERNKLSKTAFPFEIGDEVVTFDGRPVGDVISDLQANYVQNVPATDRENAEIQLTVRKRSRGLMHIPKGPIVIGVRRQGATETSEVQLIWDYTPEAIFQRGNLANLSGSVSLQKSSIFHPIMSVDFDGGACAVEHPYDRGARKIFTPDLGTKLWESPADSNFYAYIFKTPEGRPVGYVRIPQYGADDYKKAVADFSQIISMFEGLTDKLVIDQAHNPGGSVFYLYALASMLTDRPLSTPLHRMSITQDDVANAQTLIAKLKDVKNDEEAQKALADQGFDGYPVTYQVAMFALNNAQFITSEWNAGRKLSRPYWVGGVEMINPNPVHYTKPILLLIDHEDYSGGDFFPTIMQDNKRATVFGARTAGAGGYVVDVTITNNIGVQKYRVTQSIAERVGGNPIENLGVTPDIPYEMTAADRQQNYEPYRQAILKALK